MQPFPTPYRGRAVPLRHGNVDTDQIVPAAYLKRVGRTGFADGLFASWRGEPGFALDDPRYAGATILLAGPDFGTGSSREHAVWALQDWGFRVVVSARFGDIFRTNALTAGLLAAVAPEAPVEALMASVEADPAAQIEIDVVARTLRAGPVATSFELDDYSCWRLLEGLDDVALTLRQEADIARYEAGRPA